MLITSKVIKNNHTPDWFHGTEMSHIEPFSITKALDQVVDASERPSLLVLKNSNVRHSTQSTQPLIPFTASITRHVSGLLCMLLPFFLGL